MMRWLRDLWTRILFLFKPTYHVYSSIEGALASLPARGGTLRVNGQFVCNTVTLPDKDVRIIGGTYLGLFGAGMVAGVGGGASKVAMFIVPAGQKGRAIFNGCTFCNQPPKPDA